jgi:hypothetical protein
LAIQVKRMVNGVGLVGLAGTQLRTMPCPISRLTDTGLGACRATSVPAPSLGPITVQRRVSQRGSIMVATQRIHVGMIHARKIVTVTAADHSFQVSIEGELVAVVPRTTSREVHRYKAYATRAGTPLGGS